jgi:hypothetical protein
VTDFYQGIVAEYLRADRSVFVNTECLIQLHANESSPHWYCDVVAVNLRSESVFLCEVSFAGTLAAMLKRLAAWNTHWPDVCDALRRDCSLPPAWHVRPWLFVPEACVKKAVVGVNRIGRSPGDSRRIPDPRITTLEAVPPWKYCTWDRRGEAEKPTSVPPSMQ